MPLKIICLEEHVSDPSLGKAAQAATVAAFPYFADLNSRYSDDPDAPGQLPALQPGRQAARLAAAPAAERIAAMDANGIDVQVLSYSDLTQLVPPGAAQDLARDANDRMAATIGDHPTRLAGFCTLPWQDPDAAVQEIERAAHELGLYGCMLSGHPGEDALIDDARYAPVLAALEALRMPLYIHPGPLLPAVQRPYYAGFDKEVSARFSLMGWGWHLEAGIQVVRLILSGALDRHPGLRLISGHWGEMVPFFLQRMDDMMPSEVTGLSRTISRTYRDQVSVTPSGMLNLPHFRFIHEVLGAERIMMSVDYPYLTMRGARAWLEVLPIDEDERAAIAHGNAKALLRL